MTSIARSSPNQFIKLTDTPKSYAGQTGNILAVKSTEDGLEFVSPSAGTENFSYDKIAAEITIPINQQMIVYRNIEINDTLNINGKLIILDV